jgi:ubiquitin carboxyl-terminal hydrolase 4/11/15
MDKKSASKVNLNLLSCLREFKSTEELDDDNKWYCSECKEHVKASKTMELYRAPPIMIVTLKRFRSGGGGNRYGYMGMGGGFGGQKLETHVDFPLEGLDMREFVLCTEQRQQSKLIYDCFAVSNHFGGVGGGHYTAFAKSVTNNKWYNYDDSRVSECRSQDDVITSSAYSLFYR